MLEKQVNLINEDIGVLALRSVLRNAVEDRVENDKHTDGHKLLAEVENIVADQAVVGINIRLLCKGIKRTVREQLNRKCDFLCFRLVLLQEFSTEVLQGRDSTRVIVLLIGTVNACGATVDNRFLLCSEIVAADKLFAKRHNELGFENNRVCTVAVFLVHIHRIDMARRGSRDIDNLAAQGFHKCGILSLRVNDDNICVR